MCPKTLPFVAPNATFCLILKKKGVWKNISMRLRWKRSYFSTLKQRIMDGFVQPVCLGLCNFHSHETGQINGCWVADVSSLSLFCCVVFCCVVFCFVVSCFGLVWFLFLFWITWRDQHMSQELSLYACLILSFSWKCFLRDSRWRFPKWETNGDEAYFTCTVGKTSEGNSFRWLWL